MKLIYFFIISLFYLFNTQQNVNASQNNDKKTKKTAIKTTNTIETQENNKNKLLNNKYTYNHTIFSVGFNIFGSSIKIDNIPNKNFNSWQLSVGLHNNLYFKLPNNKIDLLLGIGIEGNINLKNNNITQIKINEQSPFITDYKDRFNIIAKNQDIYNEIISRHFNNLKTEDYKQYIENNYTSRGQSFFNEVKEKIEQNNNDIIQLAPAEGTGNVVGNIDNWEKERVRASINYFSDPDIENKSSIYAMLKTGITEDDLKNADYTKDPFYKYYNHKGENTSAELLNAFDERQEIIKRLAKYTDKVREMAKDKHYITDTENENTITFDNIDYDNIQDITALAEEIKTLQESNDNFIILKDYSTNDDYVSYEEAYNNYLENKALDIENITDEEKKQATIYAMLKTGITEDNLKNADYTKDPFYKYDKINKQTLIQYSAYEKLNATIKFGAKYKFNNNYSAQLYLPVGLNLLQITETINTESKRIDKIGLTVGIGADFIIKERFSIGVLYRYGYNRYNNITFNTNILQFKFGINLL